MTFNDFSMLPEPAFPASYALRTYVEGDDEVWLRLLSSGNFGKWDRGRLDRMKAGERAPLPLDGVFFVTANSNPVGTACVFLYESKRGTYSEFGWLAVDPEWRGRGLGEILTRKALFFAGEQLHHHVFLKTEEFRLAAIKTYLKVGFQPEMVDSTHCGRWTKLREHLGFA